jgi:hypothetical protein
LGHGEPGASISATVDPFTTARGRHR